MSGFFVRFRSSKALVSCARNTHFLKNVKKRMSPRWQQLPQEPPLARFISETKKNVAPLCGQMSDLFYDTRPRHPARDYKCGDKSNLFGKVPSRARETLTFGAVQNSTRGNCRLAYTKQLLSSIPELRISIRARETCPSSCRDSDSIRQPSGRSLAG